MDGWLAGGCVVCQCESQCHEYVFCMPARMRVYARVFLCMCVCVTDLCSFFLFEELLCVCVCV